MRGTLQSSKGHCIWYSPSWRLVSQSMVSRLRAANSSARSCHAQAPPQLHCCCESLWRSCQSDSTSTARWACALFHSTACFSNSGKRFWERKQKSWHAWEPCCWTYDKTALGVVRFSSMTKAVKSRRWTYRLWPSCSGQPGSTAHFCHLSALP